MLSSYWRARQHFLERSTDYLTEMDWQVPYIYVIPHSWWIVLNININVFAIYCSEISTWMAGQWCDWAMQENGVSLVEQSDCVNANQLTSTHTIIADIVHQSSYWSPVRLYISTKGGCMPFERWRHRNYLKRIATTTYEIQFCPPKESLPKTFAGALHGTGCLRAWQARASTEKFRASSNAQDSTDSMTCSHLLFRRQRYYSWPKITSLNIQPYPVHAQQFFPSWQTAPHVIALHQMQWQFFVASYRLYSMLSSGIAHQLNPARRSQRKLSLPKIPGVCRSTRSRIRGKIQVYFPLTRK